MSAAGSLVDNFVCPVRCSLFLEYRVLLLPMAGEGCQLPRKWLRRSGIALLSLVMLLGVPPSSYAADDGNQKIHFDVSYQGNSTNQILISATGAIPGRGAKAATGGSLGAQPSLARVQGIVQPTRAQCLPQPWNSFSCALRPAPAVNPAYTGQTVRRAAAAGTLGRALTGDTALRVDGGEVTLGAHKNRFVVDKSIDANIQVSPQTYHVEVLGEKLEIKTVPVGYEFDWGEPRSYKSRRAAVHSTPQSTHSYKRAGRYRITVRTTWSATWSGNSGDSGTFTYETLAKSAPFTVKYLASYLAS